jgi:TolB-like protein
VLPFRKFVTTEDSYFADGIVDNIIQSLAALKELLVIARGSTLGFGGGAINTRAIGRALGVRYLLYGSVQRSGDRLRIGTELSDAESGEVLRVVHYDGATDELFQLQDRIAEETAKMIAPHVRERELKRALRKHPQNMTAYDLVLQALELLHRLDYAAFSRARGLLQRAMILDPSYSPAFSYAAWWHNYRIAQEWSTDIRMDGEESVRLATAAIERDQYDALGLATYGHVMSLIRKSYTSALESLERALIASPNSAISWTLKAATLSYIGDGPSAVRCARKGLELSPIDSNIAFIEHILSQAFYVNGEYEKAIEWGERSAKHNNRRSSNLRILAASHVAVGQIARAREVARQQLSVVPDFSLLEWQARTPIEEPMRRTTVQRLREAGLPD